MKFLGPVLAGVIFIGAGAAQAAVVHHFEGWGRAFSPRFDMTEPVGFEGYTGAYKRVEVAIRFSDWDINYGIQNDSDAPITLPVTASMLVDMQGPGLSGHIEAFRAFTVMAPAYSYEESNFRQEWSFSKHYSFIDPEDLGLFSSSFEFWVEGLFSVWGNQGDALVQGIAPLYYGVSVDYLSEVPVPATGLLLLSGLGGAAAIMRRRR